MKVNLVEIIIILISYLSGSVPFGYIFTKKYTGKNIRELGSGNIGSTNVKRVAGLKASISTQISDMLKGLLPVAIVLILKEYKIFQFNFFLIYLVALATIIGHNFSIFLRFKGGKGVNTTLGASLLLGTLPVFISVAVYYIIKWSTKYVSLGSICLAITLPLVEYFQHNLSHLFFYFTICSMLIIIRHIDNIKRLIKGTENKSNSKADTFK